MDNVFYILCLTSPDFKETNSVRSCIGLVLGLLCLFGIIDNTKFGCDLFSIFVLGVSIWFLYSSVSLTTKRHVQSSSIVPIGVYCANFFRRIIHSRLGANARKKHWFGHKCRNEYCSAQQPASSTQGIEIASWLHLHFSFLLSAVIIVVPYCSFRKVGHALKCLKASLRSIDSQ